jgi:hemerythrin-like domain-containing protein
MKATDLLEDQHKEVATLFKRIESAKGGAEKNKLFEELAQNIAGHDAIEREIFYPACQKEMGTTDLLGEALVEHGVVELSLYLADQARGEDDFDFEITVLREIIEHHVEEEENELFPRVEKALGAEMLEQLGAEMKERFEESKEEDFRPPLHDNLTQVLAGASETEPAEDSSKKPVAKKTAKKAAKKTAKTAHKKAS